MSKSLTYTNGVIAVREKYLLKDKIFKLCEGSAEDALRSVSESGFGRGAEVVSVFDFEKLITADETDIDAFIREYAPSAVEREYFLSPRDFHNAKALIKALHLNLDTQNLLAPDGIYSSSLILDCIKKRDYSPLNKELEQALESAEELFADGETVSGAEIGLIFEKALIGHLSSVCSKNPLLKRFITIKADMTNILTALRSTDETFAKNSFVTGGKIKEDKLLTLLYEDGETAEAAFRNMAYSDFVKSCLDAKRSGLPMMQAEKIAESYETEYFSAKKYDLKRSQPFLYYVFRRRIENSNVRILFVCLLAGMREQDIRKRLRAI